MAGGRPEMFTIDPDTIGDIVDFLRQGGFVNDKDKPLIIRKACDVRRQGLCPNQRLTNPPCRACPIFKDTVGVIMDKSGCKVGVDGTETQKEWPAGIRLFCSEDNGASVWFAQGYRSCLPKTPGEATISFRWDPEVAAKVFGY